VRFSNPADFSGPNLKSAKDDSHFIPRLHSSSRCPSPHPTPPQQLNMTITASYVSALKMTLAATSVSTAAQDDAYRLPSPAQATLSLAGPGQPGPPNLPQPSPAQHKPAWHILGNLSLSPCPAPSHSVSSSPIPGKAQRSSGPGSAQVQVQL
jgi:hypothetical protein